MNLKKLNEYLVSEQYDNLLTARLLVMQESQDNFFKRQEILAKCADDPIFFIENFCWVFEPRYSLQPDLEFFLFPFQKDAIEDFRKAEVLGEDRLYEKSRDMGFSWMVAAYFVWRWKFTRGWIGLYGSRKQEETDNKTINSFFGKVRYIVYRLPAYMMPEGFKKKQHDNENKMMNPEMNSMIQGESSNPNFSRDRRCSVCVIDELFLQDYAQDMWRNAAETAKCRIGVSTPKPTVFAQTLKEAMGINGWLRSFHWSLHPFKDAEWYEQTKKRYEGDEVGLRTELELEYRLDPSILVYPQAEAVKLMPGFEYDKNLPLYVSMDWGNAPSQTVFCWSQLQEGKWVVLESLKAMDKALDWYVPFLCPELDVNPEYLYRDREKDVLTKVRGWRKANYHFGEAAHYMKASTSNTSIAQELGKEPRKVYLRYNALGIAHDKRQAAVKQMMVKGLLFNDTFYNRSVLDDLRMSRFPATKGTNEKVSPVHDNASDARSAIENLAVNVMSGSLKIKVGTYRKYG
jgi:hypothetical protein